MNKNNKTILLNATTIVKGGGIQAAVAIIRFIFSKSCVIGELHWIFAVSQEVHDELLDFGIELREGFDLCLDASPAKNKSSRKILRGFANSRANVVFTFFGPAYVKFSIPHLCGVADGWVTHSSALAFSTLSSVKEKLHMLALCLYKALWLRQANAWVVEQEVARKGLASRLHLPKENIYVVENNCSQTYLDTAIEVLPKPLQSPIKILTFAAYYPHKGLELIPHIALRLINDHNITNFRLIVTIPENQYRPSRIVSTAQKLGVLQYIENIGPVRLADGPSLYRNCDISFLPSVLETFSATYPESMRMGLPIVTSDLQFAHNTCQNAAIYFEPMCANDAAAKLANLINSYDLREHLVRAGFARSIQFPTPAQKYAEYSSIIQSLLASST